MSYQSTKTTTPLKPCPVLRNHLPQWYSLVSHRMESLSVEQKCRVTRVHSTDLINLISKRLPDILQNEDSSSKHHSRKDKPRTEFSKVSEESVE